MLYSTTRYKFTFVINYVLKETYFVQNKISKYNYVLSPDEQKMFGAFKGKTILLR